MNPLSIKDSEYRVAVLMQLRESGDRVESADSLVETAKNAELGPLTIYDISVACNMTVAELASARDAELAHRLAQEPEAGAESPVSSLDNSPRVEPVPDTKYGTLTGLNVTAAELTLARDAELAYMIARCDGEDGPSGQSSEECSICMEATEPIDRFLSSKCGHSFCKTCMRRHLEIVATETHQYPLTCPQCQVTNGSCPTELDAQDCLSVMVGTGAAHKALESLLLERQHFARMRYCAYPACSMPFDWVDDPAIRGRRDEYKVKCPSCAHLTCVNCKVQWHSGRTCEQYVAAKDGTEGLSNLVRRKAWKACPKCFAVIERRRGGCNFVKCRCGCGFCYNCGKEYVSMATKGATNLHGSPNCSCGLFGR